MSFIFILFYYFMITAVVCLVFRRTRAVVYFIFYIFCYYFMMIAVVCLFVCLFGICQNEIFRVCVLETFLIILS
jgi:hypothetical protein